MLYGGNTVGAVFGCLLAGFYLLRIYDVAVATYAAAAINLVVAAISFALAARTPARIEAGSAENAAEAAEAARLARSTSPSRFRAPAHWAPKWSGPG